MPGEADSPLSYEALAQLDALEAAGTSRPWGVLVSPGPPLDGPTCIAYLGAAGDDEADPSVHLVAEARIAVALDDAALAAAARNVLPLLLAEVRARRALPGALSLADLETGEHRAGGWTRPPFARLHRRSGIARIQEVDRLLEEVVFLEEDAAIAEGSLESKRFELLHAELALRAAAERAP